MVLLSGAENPPMPNATSTQCWSTLVLPLSLLLRGKGLVRSKADPDLSVIPSPPFLARSTFILEKTACTNSSGKEQLWFCLQCSDFGCSAHGCVSPPVPQQEG